MSSLYILEIRPLSHHWQICFPYCSFSLYFNAFFFSHAVAFYFDDVPLVNSFHMSLVLGDVSVRMLLHGMSEIFLAMISSRAFMVL